MIDYLEQLVEEKKYREALSLAEQLLKTVESPHDLVKIHAATVVSHCMVGEYETALAGGDSAIELARGIEDWDSFGKLTVWVGIAYGLLGQYEEAISRIYQYLGHIPRYEKASVLEMDAWYNLGIAQDTLGRSLESSKSLANSLEVSLRRGELRFAHGVRQALIQNHLEAGRMGPVPRLLAQSAHYLRNYPNIEGHTVSWTYHIKFRSEYALATGRTDRAEIMATRALVLAQGHLQCEFLLHVVLAKVASKKERFAEAVNHSVAARICAVAIRRADLEAEATELFYEMSRTLPATNDVTDRH